MKTYDIIRKLVSIYSPSGEEHKIAQLLQKYFTEMGLKPIFIENNLVLHIKGHNESKAIIFNAHMDTVSPGDTLSWKNPSLKATLLKGKVYGLGTSDMKASLTSLILLTQKLIREIPKCDVWFSFVTNEELDGSGTKKFLNWFLKNKYLNKYKKVSAIICEPTNLEEIVLGHKGNIFINIITRGDSGHGSKPELIKNNAIFDMLNILSQIEQNKKNILSKSTVKLLAEPTIGITMIGSSSNSPNKFSDSCTSTLDFRFPPRFTENPKRLLTKMISNKYSYEIELLNEIDPKHAPIVRKDERIVLALSRASKIKKYSIYPFSTDMPSFIKQGISACIFGPGNPSVIHKPNEYCEINKIEAASEIFYKTISEYSDLI